jgi:hypothetical protein
MRTVLVVAAMLLTGACGGQTSLTVHEAPSSTPTGPAPTVTSTSGGEPGGIPGNPPPPFRVRYDGQELVLHPHTYCLGACVDGIATNPPEVGSPARLQVYVPVEEFTLSAYARELTSEPRPNQPSFEFTCGGRSFALPVEDLGDGWYAVRPAGPAAHYEVELFAQGGGDMIANLRWRTPADQAMPEPSARLALIADHDGRPDSYGLELAIDDLAETPRHAVAEIEVTAGNGRSLTFEATQSKDACRSAGDLYFDGPDEPAQAAARLGGFPFTTTVTLTLDGRVHRATATYPDDEIEGNEPSVDLEFTPELPAGPVPER